MEKEIIGATDACQGDSGGPLVTLQGKLNKIEFDLKKGC